jgi:hypothetical protein
MPLSEARDDMPGVRARSLDVEDLAPVRSEPTLNRLFDVSLKLSEVIQ